MNIRGYFMLLMSTIWRTVVTQLKAAFRCRLAGGSDNALLPERNGRAVFKKVYGKTVKFNQLVQNGNFADTSHWTSWSISPATLAVAGNVATIRKDSSASYGGFLYDDGIIPNTTHKYYLTAKLARVDASAFFGFVTSSGSQGSNTMLASFTTNLEKYALITSPSSNTDKLCLRCGLGSSAINSSCKAADVMTIDLTDIFGTDAGIAAALGIAVADITTATGVAAFEAWLALNPGYQDYYPYDEGSLISFTGSGVKVTGWNKFHVVNGSGVADVKKDVKYYVAGPFGSLHYSDGTAISVASDRTFTAIKDDTITFGSVSNSIVLNIYTGTAKDGTYEPYHEEVVDLSGAYINVWDEVWELGAIQASDGEIIPASTAIRSKNYIKVLPNTDYYFKTPLNLALRYYTEGKEYIGYTDKNGISNANNDTRRTHDNCGYIKFQIAETTYAHDICINVSNADINGTYFPHALQSAGSVTDEVTATGLTKKLRRITITAEILKYFRNSVGSHINIGYTDAHIADGAKVLPSATTVRNAITTLYGYTITGQDAAWITNMRIGIAANGQLAISNNSFTSLAEFQALCPFDIIYEVEDYITISHDTPMQYAVDKYSTEEVVVPASADGSPTSTNIVADIEYQAR